MKRTDFIRICQENQPLVIKVQKGGAGYDSGTVGRIDMSDHIHGICKGEQNRNTVMSRNEQKIPTVFFSVIAAGAAADIEGISVVSFCRFQKAYQSFVWNTDFVMRFQIAIFLS